MIVRRLFERAAESVCREKGKLVEAALGLPYVDNAITMHKVVMFPRSKRMRVPFNNAWCGRDALHEVDTTRMFS